MANAKAGDEISESHLDKVKQMISQFLFIKNLEGFAWHKPSTGSG
jgi:hypothetical protein